MMAAVCPYCRAPVDTADEELVCNGCGTPHHTDCYAENGGCTVFGCSAAPEDEPKLSVARADLTGEPGSIQKESKEVQPAPPPPVRDGSSARPSASPLSNAGSVLFRPVPIVATATVPMLYVDFTPDPNAKDRRTFILLGIFLGMVGAHNFYAGYRGKALAQLGITVLSAGFASPMSWVWGIIDICTVVEDSKGVKFKN